MVSEHISEGVWTDAGRWQDGNDDGMLVLPVKGESGICVWMVT